MDDTAPLTPPLSHSDCCFSSDISSSPSSAGPPTPMPCSGYTIPLPDNCDMTLAYERQFICQEERTTPDHYCDTTLAYGREPLCQEGRIMPDNNYPTPAYERQPPRQEESTMLTEYHKPQCDGIPYLDQLTISKCYLGSQINQRKKPGRKKGQGT